MQTIVDNRYLQSLQRYLFRFVALQSMFQEVLNELPPDRQRYYIERHRGIDTRVKEMYYGNQDKTYR